ncbi:hypothetical protein II906_07620, partial [bacterium]|nr:hypothetical protein [bacterium]
MKISSIQKNISFGKTLAAKAGFLYNGIPQKGYIYKLNKKEDKDYFEKLMRNRYWSDNNYLHFVQEEFEDKKVKNEAYTMEAENGFCLGYAITEKEAIKTKGLEYIETCPKFSSENEQRNVKYIGESMIAFLAQRVKRDRQKIFLVPAPVIDAVDFYTSKCGFKMSKLM